LLERAFTAAEAADDLKAINAVLSAARHADFQTPELSERAADVISRGKRRERTNSAPPPTESAAAQPDGDSGTDVRTAGLSQRAVAPIPDSERLLGIVAERYARGEIGRDEYLQIARDFGFHTDADAA
jgi:hypothetical protein